MSDVVITTNGFRDTWMGIEYGAWFAKTMKLKVTLLGVTEHLSPAAIDDHHPLETVFERAVSLFKEMDLEYSLEVQNGSAEEIIPQRANRSDSITVLSPLGRTQIRRWLVGRTFRQFMESIKNPILYVPEIRLPLKKLLICVGGLGYEVDAEHLGLQLAMQCNAEVTLLHVVPPVDLDYPTARVANEQWRNLIHTDTVLGRNLRNALEAVQNAGVTAKLEIRQGHIVEEISAVMKAESYDLLCMGSAYGGGNTLRQLYAPNVTAEIAEAAHCAVLTARHRAM